MTSQSRRHFLQGSLALTSFGLLAGCGLASFPGQQPPSPRRIGYLDSDASVTAGLFTALREGLRDRGWVEGKNLVIESRDAAGIPERLPAFATELVGVPVDLIVVPNPIAASPARQVTSTTPIVAAGGNIVAAGLVTNVARPEGNLTGVTTNNVETVGKWLELLKETVPAIARLGILRDPANPTAQTVMQEVQRSAASLELLTVVYELTHLDRLAAVLATVKADGADGMVVLSGGVLGSASNPRIGGQMLRAQLPAVAENRGFAVQGGLLAHGPDIRCARQAIGLFRGHDPQGCEAGRSADRVAHRIQHRGEPQDRPGAGDHRPPVGTGPSDRGHPVGSRHPRTSIAEPISTPQITPAGAVGGRKAGPVPDRHPPGMLELLILLLGALHAVLRNRADLAAENLLRRHHLAVLTRPGRKRPPLRARDKLLWVLARRLCVGWRRHLVLVRPETVVRWHRHAWTLFWRWRSQARLGRPRLSPQVRELIAVMSRDHPRWGTERIRGELLKLGSVASNRSIRRYRRPGPARPPSQTWRTFLANHPRRSGRRTCSRSRR